jgi:tRNA(adenine34) deaminase
MKKPEKKHRWVSSVKTVSTSPPEGTFTKDAKTVARIMARKTVSPKGIGSGIRMIQYFINRAGKGLSATRKKELHRAIEILQEKQKHGAGHKTKAPAHLKK